MTNNENEYINEEELQDSLSSFKDMLKQKTSKYFEVHEFEYILEYYIERNDIANANLAIKYAMTIHPKSYELYKKLAQVLILSEDYEKAIRISKKALKDFGEQADLDYFLVIGEAYLKTERIEDAEKAFYKALKMADDEFYNICYSIAISYEQEDRHLKAIKYFKLIEEENKNLLFDIAMSYYSLEDYKQSVSYFKKHLKHYVFSLESWFYQGKSLFSLSNYDEAIDAFEYVLSIDSQYTPALYELAKLWVIKADYFKALETYKEILLIEQNPDNTFWLSLGDVYFNLERYVDARKTYLKVLKNDEESEDAFYSLSLIDIVEGEYRWAENHIKKAIAINSQLPEFWVTLGNVQQFLFQEDRAEQSYLKAIQLNPYFDLAWKSIVDFYFYANDVIQALSYLVKSQTYIGESAEIYYKLTAFNLELQDLDKAVSFLEKALLLDASQYKILYEYFPEAGDYKLIQKLINLYQKI